MEKITETDRQIAAIGRLELAIEQYNEAKEKMPKGYEFFLRVPMDDANLIKRYFDDHSPFAMPLSDFAAGETFYFRGIKCYATP
jgi:hypothetical protein